MRLHAWTSETESGGTWNGTGSKTNHYDDDGDSPAWIDEGGGAITRTVGGIAGDLAATTSASGAIKLQLATLHGDVGQEIALASTTAIDTAVPTAFRDADEYGNAKPTGQDQDGNPVFNTARYGWLGAKQRSTETVGSTLTLMGVRLYNPATGRFLSIDPIRGGNPNAYTYPVDPVNMHDLDGRWGFAIRACFRLCGRIIKPVLRKTWSHVIKPAARWTFGQNSYLFGRGAHGYRKGWLNRGPIRTGWGWKGNQNAGHPIFRTGIGWPKHKQNNWLQRTVGHRHIDWWPR